VEYSQSDFVFIATGHGTSRTQPKHRDFEAFVCTHARRNDRLLFVRNPYPVEKLVGVNTHAIVAIQGLGLAAYDVVSELSIGRGGRFVHRDGKLLYQKSGREPRMLLFSRSGLPFAARGKNEKAVGHSYKAHFFTKEAVGALRADRAAARGARQLDFDRELLPLLEKEMTYVYRSTKEGRWLNPETFTADDLDSSVIRLIMDPLQGPRFRDLLEYRRFFLNYLAEDLEEAEKGNVSGPIKAAVDVIRGSLQTLRFAVEYGGLVPVSHQRFIEYHLPTINRLTQGPPSQRNYELLALFEAGVVDLASGPGPVISADGDEGRFVIESEFAGGPSRLHADVLINARVDAFRPEEDSTQLFQNLLARGLIRPYCNGAYRPGGLDIDHHNHPIDRQGEPLSRIWVVGYPVEGANYFTTSLPLPGAPSRPIADATKCVVELFRMLSPIRPATAPNSTS
jgi:uncharacterized NAD(P)/FAD-binding protein YdhS